MALTKVKRVRREGDIRAGVRVLIGIQIAGIARKVRRGHLHAQTVTGLEKTGEGKAAAVQTFMKAKCQAANRRRLIKLT